MKAVRLSIAGSVVAVILSSCAASATPVLSEPPAARANLASDRQEDVQNSREKEMVFLFQSLILMNKREQLKISAKQAEALLPMIKRNSSDGELGSADYGTITALLTAEQKKYVNDFMEEMRLRKEQLKVLKEQEGISDEERARMIREFIAKREQEREGQPPLPVPRRNPDEDAAAGSGGSPGGKNIEQQLIDILEAKLRKEQGNK